eukprot:147419-Prorocentrum_minimum.AAC.1
MATLAETPGDSDQGPASVPADEDEDVDEDVDEDEDEAAIGREEAPAEAGREGVRVLYVSAEESVDQIADRARRLGVDPASSNLFLYRWRALLAASSPYHHPQCPLPSTLTFYLLTCAAYYLYYLYPCFVHPSYASRTPDAFVRVTIHEVDDSQG